MATTESNPQRADASPTARQLLVDWANAQDGWTRRLVLEVLATGNAASPTAIDDIYDHFLAEKGLAEDAAPIVPPLEYQEPLGDVSGQFLFRRLENVQGVNALSKGQQITFNPGLTILFGENATGKTGYARVLKKLADVRTAEQILPNVHEPQTATDQKATVVYSVGDDEKVLEWKGEAGIPPMTHVSVFDSPAVRFHVDEDLAYVYTPRDLALFRAVSEGIDAVKARADADIAKHRPASNPYLTHFKRGSTVYTHIETLGPATDLPALQALGTVTQEQEKAAGLLRTSVSALQSGSIQAQLTAARARVQVYDDLAKVIAATVGFDVKAHAQAIIAAKTAASTYSQLRTDLLSSAGISDESEEAWQEFILAAETYRGHLKDEHYPTQGEPCLYCRQPLGSDATALLLRYHDFATDATRARIDEARAQAKKLVNQLAVLDRPAVTAAIKRHRQDDPDDKILIDAESLLTALDEQATAWNTDEVVEWPKIAGTATGIEEEATARRTAAQTLVGDLTTRSTERAARLEEDSAKLAELDARIELKKRLAEIEGFVADAKWVQRLEQLLRKFPALLRSLTEVSKTASEQLLNADFERRFAEECQALRAPTVRLEFPGRRGQPARRKVISAEHRPSQVLSEGEQKVIAIADFLAESALRLIPAPVIFDDPVNSLDYRRIHEVALRIARLAKERQVIVFTHSIWLATELLSHFEKETSGCTYYSVTDDNGKGIIVAGTHPRWDTVKSTTKKIDELVTTAKTAQGDTKDALIEAGYSRMRTWCEVVVEEELLKGVTQRYRANVVMTKLSQIKGDRLAAATSVIDPIFEKCCRIMEGHSQPLETLSVRPTLEELEKDWVALQAARSAYNA
ncbi:MAG: AAA family ATPase [Solirubrobacteraceae bacterium]